MSILPFEAHPLPLRCDEEGTIRFLGSRVALDSVLSRYQQGLTPESIAESLPSLALADIYAALAWYLTHTKRVDAYLAQRQAEARRLRAEWEATHPDSKSLQERLKAHGAPTSGEGRCLHSIVDPRLR